MANESILTSIKKLLGLSEDYTEFDVDVAMHINSAFATLNQLGVGPINSLYIEDKTTNWDEFIQGQLNINSVKTYVYFKVRLIFDPPATSFAITSMENMAKELEFRLNVVMENVKYPSVSVQSSPQVSLVTTPSTSGTFRYLTIPQGTSWEVRWPVQNSDGSPADLSSWTPRAQARNNLTDMTLLYEWTIAAGNISVLDSSIAMAVEPAVSSTWTWRSAIFDVELVHIDGRVIRIGRGEIIIDPEVTI